MKERKLHIDLICKRSNPLVKPRFISNRHHDLLDSNGADNSDFAYDGKDDENPSAEYSICKRA